MKVLLLILMIGMSAQISAAENTHLGMPKIFSDHMVLQREAPVSFWGWSDRHEIITVSIDGFSVQTKANGQGEWQVNYPESEAGGPFEVTVKSEHDELKFRDVYFGDVWLAGGQSNMEWKLSWNTDDWEDAVANSDYPRIRFFEVPQDVAHEPKKDVLGGNWIVASPETSPNFSAVAWYFALRNHLDKEVPVGIIDNNWGGTPAESWISAGQLRTVPGYKSAAEMVLNPDTDWDEVIAQNNINDREKDRIIADVQTGLTKGVHQSNYDDSDWEVINLPTVNPLNHVVWLRKIFQADEDVTQASLFFGHLEQIADMYINGEHVIHKGWQDTVAVMDIDADVIQKGENYLVIRAVNSWNNEVEIGREGDLWISLNGKKISLEGQWRFSNSIDPEIPPVKRLSWMPSFLFNAMIHPVAGYTMQGAIWYQGESNTDRADVYRDLFKEMIVDWRLHWKQGNFSFLFVQLANFMERHDHPTESQWAELREAQTQTLDLPKTGMAVTIDIGDAIDIHPRNKKDVGERLWLAARHITFGEEITYSGPEIADYELQGNVVSLFFNHAQNGFKIRGDEIKGFALAGSDKQFVWADAIISGDSIKLSHPDISEPKYVRYGWADNPQVNVYNAEGLPAIPFQFKVQ